MKFGLWIVKNSKLEIFKKKNPKKSTTFFCSSRLLRMSLYSDFIADLSVPKPIFHIFLIFLRFIDSRADISFIFNIPPFNDNQCCPISEISEEISPIKTQIPIHAYKSRNLIIFLLKSSHT